MVNVSQFFSSLPVLAENARGKFAWEMLSKMMKNFKQARYLNIICFFLCCSWWNSTFREGTVKIPVTAFTIYELKKGKFSFLILNFFVPKLDWSNWSRLGTSRVVGLSRLSHKYMSRKRRWGGKLFRSWTLEGLRLPEIAHPRSGLWRIRALRPRSGISLSTTRASRKDGPTRGDPDTRWAQAVLRKRKFIKLFTCLKQLLLKINERKNPRRRWWKDKSFNLRK